MKWLNEFIGRKYPEQLEIDQLFDLALIHQPDVNLVFFKRPIDSDIKLFARFLIQESFRGINTPVSSVSVARIVNDHLSAFGLFIPGKTKLTQDIIEIVLAFLRLTNANQSRLILKVVSDDACHRFHTDAYDLRLLCTYTGKGTEWIEDRYVNRRKLASGSNTDIIKDFSRIQVMEPFEVAILKGEIPSRPECKGIVHRSPPRQGVDEKRLLLRIDF